MTDTPASGAAWRGQVAPVAAITVFGLSIAMSYPLLALLLERYGASGAAIGFNTMASALSMVVFAPILPRIMARTGLGPLMLGSGIALAVLMLCYPLMPHYGWWIGLRLIHGFFATALFFASEYWIVACAPAGRRGQVIAIYALSLSVTFMAGPLLIGATGIDGMLPFALASAIMMAGVLPILWGLRSVPPASPEAPPSPRTTLRFFVTDPGVVWAVVLFGIIEFGAVALLPVWAVRSGLSEREAVLVMASFAGGSVVCAPLLGWIADRFDRRCLLALVGMGAVIAPLGMVALAGSIPGVIAFGMLWGGTAVGLYTLPLTELGARYAGHRLAEGNAAVILAYGIGALISPVALGAAMDLVPPDGLLLLAAGLAAAYTGLITLRIIVARRNPLDTHADPGS